jgi:hypothetical protein
MTHADDEIWPICEEKVPSGHKEHVDDASMSEYLPTPQEEQDIGEIWPVLSRNFPTGHVEQDVDACLSEYVPA